MCATYVDYVAWYERGGCEQFYHVPSVVVASKWVLVGGSWVCVTARVRSFSYHKQAGALKQTQKKSALKRGKNMTKEDGKQSWCCVSTDDASRK